MPIRDILLHYGPGDRCAERVEVAIALAKRHNAHLTAVFTLPDWTPLERLAAASGGADPSGIEILPEEMVTEAEAAFGERAARAGVPAEWRTMEGPPGESMVLSARHADLVVLGQADPDQPAIESEIQEEVVLGGGRPVLLVPYAGHFPEIGRRVLLAWNGSRESARALHDALPLLSAAEEVIVYGVNMESERHLPGADIAEHLARHGLPVSASWVTTGPLSAAVGPSLRSVGDSGFTQHGELLHAPSGRLSEGDALLDAVSDLSIDLVVMGAYGHSRLRELAFGGVTRQFFRAMTVPVLMSH